MEILLNKGAAVSTWSNLRVPMWIWMIGNPQATALKIIGQTFSTDHQLIPEMYMRDYWMGAKLNGRKIVQIGPKHLIPPKLAFKPRQVNNESRRIATTPGIYTIANRLDRSSLNRCDQDGNTILMTATDRGHYQLAHSLLDQGAAISPQNKKGETAVSLSLPLDDLSVLVKTRVFEGGNFFTGVETQLHTSTFLDPYSFGHRICQDEALSLRLLPQVIKPDKETRKASLAKAIILRYHRVVHALLDRGVGVNTLYGSGHTPLLLACSDPVPQMCMFLENEFSGKARAIMGRVFTVSDGIENDTTEQASLAHDSVASAPENAPAFEATVRVLLSKGANMEEDFDGMTPLALAGSTRQLSIFRELLRAGADISRVPSSITQEIAKYLRRQPDSRETLKDPAKLIDTLPTHVMRDFQMHDYCRLLMQSWRLNSQCYFPSVTVRDDAVLHTGDFRGDKGCQITLTSSTPSSAEGLAKTNTQSDSIELLDLIEHAKADRSRIHRPRELCLRHVFWSFGRSEWSIIREFQRDDWLHYMRWTRLINSCLFCITPWNQTYVPDIRLRSPDIVSSRTQAQLHFLGCIKHE